MNKALALRRIRQRLPARAKQRAEIMHRKAREDRAGREAFGWREPFTAEDFGGIIKRDDCG